MQRRRLAIAAIAFFPAVLLVASSGCSTDGTTPDCTLPNNQCGPDLDGSVNEASSEAAPAETGTDAPVDDAADAGSDAKIDGDASAG